MGLPQQLLVTVDLVQHHLSQEVLLLMLAVVEAVMDQAVGQADRVVVVLVALINLTLAQTELPILAVVEEGEERLQVEATVALGL